MVTSLTTRHQSLRRTPAAPNHSSRSTHATKRTADQRTMDNDSSDEANDSHQNRRRRRLPPVASSEGDEPQDVKEEYEDGGDEDEDDEDELATAEAEAYRLLNQQITNEAGRQILRDLQLNLNDLRSKNRKLEATSKKNSNAAKRLSVSTHKLTPAETLLKNAAKRFAFEHSCFLPDIEDFKDDPSTLMEDPDPRQVRPDVALELPHKEFVTIYRAALPPAFRGKATEDETIAFFIKYVKQFRSEISNKLRENASKFLDRDIYVAWLNREDPEQHDFINKLLGFQSNPEQDGTMISGYNVMPPVIYKDGDTENPDGLFRRKMFPLAMRCILFGPAVTRSSQPSNNKCYGKMWGYSKGRITLSSQSMAFSVIFVVFVLAGDPDFNELPGKNTEINYFERFIRWTAFFKDLSRYTQGRQTLAFWHNIVFKGVKREVANAPREHIETVASAYEAVQARIRQTQAAEEIAE